MNERADVMKLFIEKGIYNLDTIRGEYNRFAEGGDKRERMPAHPRNREKDPEAYDAAQQWRAERQQRRQQQEEQNRVYVEEKAERNARAAEELNRHKDTVMSTLSDLAGSVPFAVAAIPFGAGIVAGGDALAATTAGQAVTSGLAPLYQAATGATIAGAPALTWADAGLTSAFGAHGIQQAIEDGGISPMTALDVSSVMGRTGLGLYNTGEKLLKFRRLEKNYTGVPHTQVDGTSVFMDEAFPKVHNQHTVWTTDDVDYARTFDGPDRTIFDVYVDPKELKIMDTPEVPEGQMVYWQGLPYRLKNGNVSYADNIKTEHLGIPKTKSIAFNNKDVYGRYSQEDTGSYIWKDGEGSLVVDWDKVPGAVKTDDVVKYSRDNGLDATRFNSVYDGGVFVNGEFFDYPINELVLNPGTKKYILPHGTPKYKIYNMLDDAVKQPAFPFGLLPTMSNLNKNNNE